MTDKQLDDILKIFQDRMQKVTDEYLRRMGAQLKEIGELIPSAQTRLTQMKRLKMNVKHIQQMIADSADLSIKDIAAVFEAIAKDNARFAEAWFGEKVPDDFLMQSLLAQFKATAGEMKNLSRTTIDSELYRNAVDKGIQAAQAGVEDYNSAIRRAIEEAAMGGVCMQWESPSVEYPNGRKKRLDSAVRQNVLDGIRKLNQANMEAIGEEFGADGIELSAHVMCADDHLPYQGKQFSKLEFAELQAKLSRPFGEWNCRHSWSPILLGISEPAYSDEELEEFKQNSREKITIDGKTKTRYEWTQEQRRIETAIRYRQDAATAAKASGDSEGRKKARRDIMDLNAYYQKIVDAAGVPAKPERMGTYYGKAAGGLKKAGAAVARNTGKNVFFNEKASYSVKLDDYSDTVNTALSRAIKNVALKGSETRTEHMYLVDLKTGKLSFYETNDLENAVGYGFRKHLKENPDNTFAFVHNHNSDGSFSETDMLTLLTTKQIRVMIAARNDGVIYVAERNGDTLKTGFFDELYPDEISDLNQRLKDGKITMSQRTREREMMLVNNLLRDYTKGKGLVEYSE